MYTRILAACVVAGGLTFANYATAQESQTDKPIRAATNSSQSQPKMQKRMMQIAQLSKRVDLTAEQKDQLRTQLSKDNQKTQQLWQQFADAHVQVIQLEAEMRAALEDAMEPEQKQQAQQNRQARASADTNGEQSVPKASSNRSTAKQSAANNSDKKSQANKVASITSDSKSKQASITPDSKSKQKGDKQKADEQSHAANKSDGRQQTEEYVWTMVIVPAQVELEPLGLSNAQQQQCDQICRSYHQPLVKGWQKIDRLHDQLVAVEAQKILDAEEVLTADQLAKLKNYRQVAKQNSGSGESKSNR